MKIKCPNCGTVMEQANGTEPVLPSDLKGTAYLVPKEIHNENVNRVKKENDNMATMRDSKGRFVSTKKSKEVNNINNNMPFTVEELMNNMAELLLQKMSATNTEQEGQVKEQVQKETEKKGVERSKFYGQELYNGHIFNPYLDRRWLPAQYLNMIANEPNHSAYTAIKKRVTFNESIAWTKKEVEKLAYLKKSNPSAFVVRKKFLNFEDVYKIMEHYVKMLNKDILEKEEKFVNGDRVDYYNYNGKKYHFGEVEAYIIKDRKGNEKIAHKVIEGDEIKTLRVLLDDFLYKVKSCHEYRKMSEILESFFFKKLDYNTKKSKTFMDRYLAQGAWFTLRNMVVFEGYTLNGETGEDAINELFKFTGLEGYKIHAILIGCLEDNGYKFRVGNYR